MVTYRKASFRGAEFEVTDRSWSSGRRLQTHEYPNKDTPYTEDLGKKSISYPITAFVIGNDYRDKLKALQDACLTEGPGVLVHPDYGTIEVCCESISVRESHTSRLMATVELTFVEAGEQAIPETSVDFAGNVTSSADDLLASAKQSFAAAFALSEGVEGLTALMGNISDVASSALENIGTGVGFAEGLVSDVQGAMNKIVGVTSFALDLKSSAKQLLNTPSALANQLDTVFSAITSLAGTSPKAFQTVRNLASQSNASENASVGNADARAEKKAMQQIEQLTKQIVVAKEAEVITTIDFENADEAETVLDTFLEDAEAVELFEPVEPSSEVIQSLRGLREIVVEYIREIVLELPRTRTIQLDEQTPSLVVAYDLYEDVSRAEEIVKKNQIPFPAFVPAGKDLKVLSE